jgi:hypothetical protein
MDTPGGYLREFAANKINDGSVPGDLLYAAKAPTSAKVFNAAAWAAMPLVISALLKQRPSAVTALTSIGLGALGYNIPALWDQAVESGDVQALESRVAETLIPKTAASISPFIKKMKTSYAKGWFKNKARGVGDQFKNLAKLPGEAIEPIRAVGGAMSVAGGAAINAGADLMRGFTMPIKGPMSVSDRALSIGSKALLGYGVYRGGKYVGKKMRGTDNYVKYLRNQVLAGNIKPGEIPAADQEAIRKLGI